MQISRVSGTYGVLTRCVAVCTDVSGHTPVLRQKEVFVMVVEWKRGRVNWVLRCVWAQGAQGGAWWVVHQPSESRVAGRQGQG